MRLDPPVLLILQEDDKVIKGEGLDSLSEDELRSACRARGMRAPFGERSGAFMKDQMREWLDLSLNRLTAHSPQCPNAVPIPLFPFYLTFLYPASQPESQYNIDLADPEACSRCW